MPEIRLVKSQEKVLESLNASGNFITYLNKDKVTEFQMHQPTLVTLPPDKKPTLILLQFSGTQRYPMLLHHQVLHPPLMIFFLN